MSIKNVAEQAVSASLTRILPVGFKIYVTDEPDNKKHVAPCLIIHAGEFEEVITPGSGIFKGPVNANLRWHPNDEDRESRVLMTTLIDRWANGSEAREAAIEEGKTETEALDIGQKAAAADLSTFKGFHCHGFMPVAGALTIDTDRKTIDYNTNWMLWCMPRAEAAPAAPQT